jgi:hypothetical protein
VVTYINNPRAPLTPSEQRVIQRLRQRRIATKQSLCQQLQLSHMTVVRALQKTGYHNSFNANAAYYTLPQTPSFDPQGLWFYKHIGFSQHGNLLQTLVALVQRAPAGSTVAELEGRLSTHVANLLCRLVRAGHLVHDWLGRLSLYFAADPQQQARQKTQRLAELAESSAPPPPARPSGPVLPAGVGALEVISLLTCLIQTPQISVRALTGQLHRQGIQLTPGQVRSVIAFYELKKKRHVERRHAGSATEPTSR